MSPENIADDEFIIRRIPGVRFKDGKPAQLNIKGRNFKLRIDKNETGVSINREAFMNPASLLKQPGTLPNSAVARAKVSDIRKLGLTVVEVPETGNPGHCEIQSNTADLEDPEIRDQLAQLFSFVDITLDVE